MNKISSLLDTQDNVRVWQKGLIRWFRMTGKNYPWRETTDPYAILVSELMLQQTQIRTVLDRKYFETWMKMFPNVQTLAKANEDVVLKTWEGLGYYNRARNLQKAAINIVSERNGKFPETFEEILTLPGVGPYTAGAVCSFAWDIPAPIVDGNVARVLTRVFKITEPIDTSKGQKILWDKAEALTPAKEPGAYNSAIMELGQRICSKGSPDCCDCPVSEFCLSNNDPAAAELPIKKKTIKITKKSEQVVFLQQNDKVLLIQEQGSRRNGLWKLPPLTGDPPDQFETLATITYPITRYQIKMTVFGQSDLKNLPEIAKNYSGEWFDLKGDLPALGAPYLKAIEQITASKNTIL